jgi:hypothetical protein
MKRDRLSELEVPADETRTRSAVFIVVASFEVQRLTVDSDGRLNVVVIVRKEVRRGRGAKRSGRRGVRGSRILNDACTH